MKIGRMAKRDRRQQPSSPQPDLSEGKGFTHFHKFISPTKKHGWRSTCGYGNTDLSAKFVGLRSACAASLASRWAICHSPNRSSGSPKSES